MRSHTLEFDGYDRNAIYPNHFSNRRYPPIPVWKKRFFDPAAFTTKKLKQCFSQAADLDGLRSVRANPGLAGWHSTKALDSSCSLHANPSLADSFASLESWKKQPFLFLSLAGIGLFVWLSAQAIQDVETGSGLTAPSSPQKSDTFSIAGLQLPTLKVNPTSTSLMAAIDPAKLDAGAIFGSGKKTSALQPNAKETALPGIGQGILQGLKHRNHAYLLPGRKLVEPFLPPVTGYPITSPFGDRIHPIFGDRQLHTGIDFGTPPGTPVRAAARGTVTFVGWDGGYGNLVIVSHANGYETFYAHLDELNVAPGDRVTLGKVIGFSGSTGYVTGPHLHFEIRLNQVALNPMNYFARFANRLDVL
jgi:murein DD-endopeptidase MepM/ murein hydrolase activator NlpD